MLKIFFCVYRFIFSRKLFYRFNKLLYLCSLRGLGVFNYENLNVSGEKYFIKTYLVKKSREKEKFIVFDVGANVGKYSQLLSNYINNVLVYAFEPHPKTFQTLSSNLSGCAGVKLFNYGISSSNKKTFIYDYAEQNGSSHASLNKDVFKSVYNSNEIEHEIEVITIDHFVDQNKIEKIDFLKIDVEGLEYEVILGAKNMIAENKIEIIQFEFTQLNSTTKVFFKDFWDRLSNNYNLYRLLPNDLLYLDEYNPTINEIFGYQNIVAINKNNR